METEEQVLERELESQLSSLRRKGRLYFGACTQGVLPVFTRAVVEKVAYEIHCTCLAGYRVEELGFFSCTFGEGGLDALEEFIAQSQSTSILESMVFSAVHNLQNDDVARLVQACPSLRMLKISAIGSPTGMDLHHYNTHSALATISGDGVVGLMDAARHLAVLDLMDLPSERMDDFAHGLVNLYQLRELHVSLKGVSHEHVNHMLESLLVLNLDSLDLRLNPPDPEATYEQGCLERLTRLLSQGDLKSLTLSSIPNLFACNNSNNTAGASSDEEGEEAAEEESDALDDFLEELRINTSLCRLELGHTLGVDEDVSVLMLQALEENSCLARFSWNTHSCVLDQAWWEGLLSSLPRLQHLSELTFSGGGNHHRQGGGGGGNNQHHPDSLLGRQHQQNRTASSSTLLLDNDKWQARLFAALHQNTSLTNFRYECPYHVLATDRVEPLLELSRRNGFLRLAKASLKALRREEDWEEESDVTPPLPAQQQQQQHVFGDFYTYRLLPPPPPPVWKDAYWPALLGQWSSGKHHHHNNNNNNKDNGKPQPQPQAALSSSSSSCSSAVYCIVQQRAIHWVDRVLHAPPEVASSAQPSHHKPHRRRSGRKRSRATAFYAHQAAEHAPVRARLEAPFCFGVTS